MARVAAAKIAERLATLGGMLRRAQRYVEGTVTDLIKPEAPIALLVKQARELQNELCARRVGLRFLLAEHLVGEADREAVTKLLRDTVLPGMWLNRHSPG